MYRPGHYGMVLFLYSFVGYGLLSKRYEHHAVAGVALVVALTMSPDWDGFVSWLPHRGPTHTVWFALLVGGTLGTVVALDGRRRGLDARSNAGLGLWGAGLGTLSVLAHLLADALNPAGVRPFAPLTGHVVTLGLFPPGESLANFGLLALGLFAVAASWRLAVDRVSHDVPALPDLVRQVYRYVRVPNRE